jgi:hypothetical protein
MDDFILSPEISKEQMCEKLRSFRDRMIKNFDLSSIAADKKVFFIEKLANIIDDECRSKPYDSEG